MVSSRVRLASQNELLEHGVKSLSDELQDVCAERDVFQQKAHRLNVEVNHIVGRGDTRILDVDALCMENRSAKSTGLFLSPRIKCDYFLKGSGRSISINPPVNSNFLYLLLLNLR